MMLRFEGFKDIEGGGDLSRIPASSAAETPDVAGGHLWAAVAEAVDRMPKRHPRHAFYVLLVEEGNVAAASRKAGISYEAGRWAMRRLLEAIDLPDARLHCYPRRRS